LDSKNLLLHIMNMMFMLQDLVLQHAV